MQQQRSFAMTGYDYVLYAGLLWGWSTSWYAFKFQLVVPPEVSVFWRFLFTAPLMFALARWQGARLVWPWRVHLRIALIGLLLFSTNFVMFYYAGERLPSGFLAVIFSLASIVSLALGVAFFGVAFNWRLALGGLLGVTGVALLFWPQITSLETGPAALAGLAFGACGTLCFSLGNQIAGLIQGRGVPMLAVASWGMVYGAIATGLYSAIRGYSFLVPATLSFWGSLAFLVLSATMLAFYTFLSLVARIGAARASYASVIFPVFALMISAVLEGYHWTMLTVLGMAFALAGNMLVLRRDAG